jgi:hypothetical protein
MRAKVQHLLEPFWTRDLATTPSGKEVLPHVPEMQCFISCVLILLMERLQR